MIDTHELNTVRRFFLCKAVTVLCALQLSSDLMPDALQSNAVGMHLLAECIIPFMRSHAGP